jgi:lysophospholipase L1-like esterase
MGVNQFMTISLGKKKAAAIIESTNGFQRHDLDANKKILVLGDSTAVGIGSSDSKYSIAGRFGKDYSQAHIETIAKSGLRLQGLDPFPETLSKKYDLIVIQIGANDILRNTDYEEIRMRVDKLLTEANNRSDNVVILHSGNVGLAPVFYFPLNKYYSYRTKKVREIYLELCKKTDTIYVDLFKGKNKDLFSTDIEKYYAPDRLHLTDEGYAFWYSEIRKAMKREDIVL